MMAAIDPQAQDVLDFWFGRPGDAEYLQSRAAWFRKDDDFDAAIRERFGAVIEAALRDQLAHWAHKRESAVALIVVLDQFPRNAFRGSARMFEGDALALTAARAMVDAGADRGLPGVMRQFVYLPFEHAEDMAMQHESMRLFGELAREQPALADLPEWARKHFDIVARFGRYPHRNALLGRESTPEEMVFLQQPGSGF
jgi:uncharacterized protein (DUF924 family)